jgi:hypothetical protein
MTIADRSKSVNFQIEYPVYVSQKVDRKVEFGDATFHPSNDHIDQSAKLRYLVEADSESEAKSLAAKEYRRKAEIAVHALNFITDCGAVLGQGEKIYSFSGTTIHTGFESIVTELSVAIAERALEPLQTLLDDSPRTERALRWYGIGLQTENPEDRIVAFWTGLEAAVEQQMEIPKDDSNYQQIRDHLKKLPQDDQYEDFRERAFTAISNARRESIRTTLERMIDEECASDFDLPVIPDSDGSVNDKIRRLRDARVDIVHRGKRVENATKKAEAAKTILREILSNRASDLYSSIAGVSTIPEGLTPPLHPGMDFQSVLEAIFEETDTLSEQEIKARSFGFYRDLDPIHRIDLERFSQWDNYLYKDPKTNEYQIRNDPKFLTSTHKAILAYLFGVGELTAETIARNINNRAEDINISRGEVTYVPQNIDDLASEEVKEYSMDLEQANLVEHSPEGFIITIDGCMYLDGRLNPDHLKERIDGD